MRIVVLFAVLAAALLGRAQVTRAWDGDIDEMYVSTERPGQTQDGVSYSREDVLMLDGTFLRADDYTWEMYFDGSDFGLNSKQHNINAFSMDPDSEGWSFYFSVSGGPVYIPDVPGKVFANDVLWFRFEEDRAPGGGTFHKVLTGREMGLNLASEKIDGLTVLDFDDDIFFEYETPEFFTYDCRDLMGDDNIYLISTVGNYVVPMANGSEGPITWLKGSGSDVLLFCATEIGYNTAGYWYKVFDSFDAGVTPRNAIDSISVWDFEDGIGGNAFGMIFGFATKSRFSAPGVAGDPSDLIFAQSIYSDTMSMYDYENFGGVNDYYPRLNGKVDAGEFFPYIR